MLLLILLSPIPINVGELNRNFWVLWLLIISNIKVPMLPSRWLGLAIILELGISPLLLIILLISPAVRKSIKITSVSGVPMGFSCNRTLKDVKFVLMDHTVQIKCVFLVQCIVEHVTRLQLQHLSVNHVIPLWLMMRFLAIVWTEAIISIQRCCHICGLIIQVMYGNSIHHCNTKV